MQFKWQLTQFKPLNWRNSKPVGQAVKQLSYNADQGHEFDLVAPGDLGIEKEVLDVLLNLVVVENFLPRADSQAGMAWQTMKWITFCPCHEETYIYIICSLWQHLHCSHCTTPHRSHHLDLLRNPCLASPARKRSARGSSPAYMAEPIWPVCNEETNMNELLKCQGYYSTETMQHVI